MPNTKTSLLPPAGTLSGDEIIPVVQDNTTVRVQLSDIAAKIVEDFPGAVPEIIEVASYSALPATGVTGKIYVTLDTSLQYRWGGSAYVQLNSITKDGIGLGNVNNTADTDKPVSAAQQAAINQRLLTSASGITGASALGNIVSLSQAAYDALGVKDAATIYLTPTRIYKGATMVATSTPQAAVQGKRVLYAFGSSSVAQTSGSTEYQGSITGISNANPCVITRTSGFNTDDGDKVYVFGCAGTTQINEKRFTTTEIDGANFSLNGVNSTTYGAYVNGQGRCFVTENTDASSDLIIGYLEDSWIADMNKYMGQRFDYGLKNNRGIPSETTTAFVQRMPQHLPPGVGITDVLCFAGAINDVASGVALSVIQSNFLAIRDYVHNVLRARLILATCTPVNGSTTVQNQKRLDYNAWVLGLESNEPGKEVVVVDFWSQVTTGAPDYNWLPGYTDDGTHAEPKASKHMGFILAEKLIPIYGVGEFNYGPGNLILNPTFTGKGGVANATHFSGATELASDWTILRTGSGIAAGNNQVLSKDVNDRQIINLSYPTPLTALEGMYLRQQILAASLEVGAWYQVEALAYLESFVQPGDTAFLVDFSLQLRSNTALLSTDGNVFTSNPAKDANGTIIKNVSQKRPIHLKTMPVPFLTGMTMLEVRLQARMKTDVLGGLSAKIVPVIVRLSKVPDPYLS